MEDKGFDYINVIPLVDIMLVLLTIVLTTSTFIATGIIPLELPKASKGSEEQLKTFTIEIDKKGIIYLDSRVVSIDSMKVEMSLKDRLTPVLIRADKDIALQVFVDVLDALKNLGFKRISLQTQERK